MIRLPTTTIILGRSDLLDYEKRRQTRGRERGRGRGRGRVSETDKLNEQLARFTVRSHPGSVDLRGYGNTEQGREVQHSQGNCEEATSIESSEASDEYEAESPSHEIRLLPECLLPEEEYGYASVGFEHSPENAAHETPRPISPSKQHDFYYGGFIETAGPDLTSYSPETPEAASTPQQLQLPSSNRLRSQNQLPRSPLYVSQNVSSSPERRPTSSLTPRVASRVANHNTPGIIFSQPARRPRRISTRTGPRTFRHQTNSFSFDSSERSSAAYEQERTVSSSTDGRAQNTDNVNLHEDLRGSSLQSSRVGSAASYKISGTPEMVGEGDSVILHLDEEDEDTNARHVGFSPQLSLPPPFSTVSRNVSRVNALPYPSAHGYIAGNSPTSPVRPSIAPIRGVGEERRHSSPAAAEHEPRESSPHSGSRFNPVTLVNRALSIYRTRSPFSHQGPPRSAASSATPTPRQDYGRRTFTNVEPTTPSRGYQVYNDAVSPDLQPQTPAQLPESRHQSRYHPSYTAPVTRAAARRGLSIDDSDGEGLQQSLPRQRQAPLYTPLRGGRSASPIGLIEGGFQGLYGGRENGDEEQSWVEGVRFNNAETRLWGARDAQNNGGSLRRTPEPDDWRVGRRN